MSYPLIAPDFYKEYTESWDREKDGDIPCEIIFTPAAAEYVFTLNNVDTVMRLMAHKEKLTFQMYNLKPDPERDAAYEKQNKEKLALFPLLQYYWPLKTLMMNILQRREAAFEKRMLVLNYAIKAVQEIIDRNQAEAIPAFVSQFIAREDYSDVLAYFAELRPALDYSMNDGLSLLDIFNTNPQFGEIMNTIYANLGIDRSKEATKEDIERHVKNYFELKKSFYTDFLKGREHYIENIMVNYLWSLSMPFADPSISVWDNYVFYCALYNAIKVMLTCYMKDKDDSDFAYAVAMFSYQFHNTPREIVREVVKIIKDAGEGNNGDMAMLVLG